MKLLSRTSLNKHLSSFQLPMADRYSSQRDGPGGEDDITVEFTRGTLDTVADVLNQARRGEGVERAEQK
jgi:hypothetical protein